MVYTLIEMMIIAAAREIRDGEKVFVGTCWPLLAATLAKKLHAPNIIMLFEGGIIRDLLPSRIPLLTTDPVVLSRSLLCGDSLDTLGILLHGGHVDAAVLNVAMVDKFGNANSTCIGDYHNPKVRLAGSGGTADLGILARRVIYILKLDKQKFPEKLIYITAPGYFDGWDLREKAGLPPDTGPESVITTKAAFCFHHETKEKMLWGLFEGVEFDEVRGGVQWDLKISPELHRIPPPTSEELRVLREEIDPLEMWLRGARDPYGEGGVI